MSERSCTVFSILAIIASAVPARADDKPAGASSQSGAITGTVVDLQGHPVRGSTVSGLAYQRYFGPVNCDADGRFRLTGLPLDLPVTIWAGAPDLARERREDVRILFGKDHDIGRIVILPGTRMVGRLVDAKGKPLPQAAVKLALYRHQLGHTITSQGTEWKLNAGADGRFDTRPLPAGEASFCFSASGKVRTFVSKKAEPGTAVVDLGDVTLPDESAVAGVVVDQERKPAPKVEVVADYDWENAAITDQEGRFALHGIGKELKLLQLRSNDYFSPKPFDVTPGRTDLKLTVIKAYEIHGSAIDAESGKAVPIDTVRLCRVIRESDGHVTLAG
jgi:hypothetical protein